MMDFVCVSVGHSLLTPVTLVASYQTQYLLFSIRDRFYCHKDMLRLVSVVNHDDLPMPAFMIRYMEWKLY